MSAEASSLRRWPEAKVIVLLIAAIVLYARIQIYPLLARAPGGPIASAAHANDFKHLYLGSWLIANDVSPYDRNAMLASAGGAFPNGRPAFPHDLAVRVSTVHGGRAAAARVVAISTRSGGRFRSSTTSRSCSLWDCSRSSRHQGGGYSRFQFCCSRFRSAPSCNARTTPDNSTCCCCSDTRLWRGQQRHAPRVGRRGLVAAFAALFKLSPGILGVTYLLRRRWFDAGVMTAAGIALLLGSFLFAPPDMYLKFLPELRDMSYGHSTWADLGQHFWRDPYNQSINAFLHRTLVYFEGSGITPWAWKTPRTANHLTIVASLAILGAFACACFKSPRTRAAERAVLAAAITASLLLPSLMWDHYLVQLAAPVGLLLWPGDDSIRSGRMQRVVAVISIVVAVIAALWIQLDAEQFRSGIGLAVMSLKLWPVLAVFVLAISCALAERPRLEAAA
jgi:hypothetical protein